MNWDFEDETSRLDISSSIRFRDIAKEVLITFFTTFQNGMKKIVTNFLSCGNCE